VPRRGKSRRDRKTNIPYDTGPIPATSQSDVATAEVEADEESSSDVSVSTSPYKAQPRGQASERHIKEDYSYVRGEVVRISAIIAFLVVALVITAILR